MDSSWPSGILDIFKGSFCHLDCRLDSNSVVRLGTDTHPPPAGNRHPPADNGVRQTLTTTSRQYRTLSNPSSCQLATRCRRTNMSKLSSGTSRTGQKFRDNHLIFYCERVKAFDCFWTKCSFDIVTQAIMEMYFPKFQKSCQQNLHRSKFSNHKLNI